MHLCHLVQLVCCYLCSAACGDEPGIGVVFGHAANGLAGIAQCTLGYGATAHHDHLRVVRRFLVACIQPRFAQCVGFVLIDFAAQRGKGKGAGGYLHGLAGVVWMREVSLGSTAFWSTHMRSLLQRFALFIPISIFIISLVVATAGCTPYMQANQALIRGDYDTAIADYEQIIANNPDWLWPRRKLTRAYALSGRYAQAVQQSNALLERESRDPWASVYGGAALLALGQEQDGAERIRQMSALPDFSIKMKTVRALEQHVLNLELPPSRVVARLDAAYQEAIDEYRRKPPRDDDDD